MEFNRLGSSGLKVSEISLGSWMSFGEIVDNKKSQECIQLAYHEYGVNFFDTAEVYNKGNAEIALGKAIKDLRRESLVIATKIFWGGDTPNEEGLSRKHLIEGTKKSLQRLQLDYVDLLYCHRPDPNTPIAETVLAMDYLVRHGYVFYWGTSEWSAAEIETAFTLAKQMNCIPPTMEQPEYNLFKRHRVEVEYGPLYKKYGLGTTIWGPLAFGILSGKYNNGIPKNSRLDRAPEWRKPQFEERINKTKQLKPIADQLNCTVAQLAIAWCLKKPNISTVIIGATDHDQLNENIQALHIKKQLTNDVMSTIERICKEQEE